MYKCKYFKIYELVPKELYEKHKNEDWKLWSLFDDRLLRAADIIRSIYGLTFVNNSHLDDCGFRLWDTKTGAEFSPHKTGKALDLHILSIETEKITKANKTEEYNAVRKELLKDIRLEKLNIRFENNVSWLHIDTVNSNTRVFKA